MKFRLVRYNPRRKMRGVEAAEVEMTDFDDQRFCLWMSKRDCERNLAESVDGDDVSGLRDALQSYRENKEIKWRSI